jgi:hypothetical protein
MDLNTVTVIARPRSRDEIKLFAEDDAYLAGGTWPFSEPQPQLRRLIDLTTLGWQSLVANEAGLSIAATCTVAELDAFELPVAWGATTLIGGAAVPFSPRSRSVCCGALGRNWRFSDLTRCPAWVRNALQSRHGRDEHRGLFKKVTLNRGRPMAPASEVT